VEEVAEVTRQLEQSWLADIAVLGPDVGADARRAEAWLLLRGWTEPHRRYHTLEHLAEVLTALRELEDAGAVSAEGARVARVAAWYHDLAYDPRAEPGSNEHRSATLARDHLHRLGVDTAVVDAVEEAVLLTVDHAAGTRRGPAEPAVLDAFHDADLWILAAPPDRFDAYCAQVREEYAHVPPATYAAARAAILRRLVAGPVYRTAPAQAWTARARENVARELARLEATAG
jgi:predicted metal-dependent HD superfamily phosphohydrolase